MTITAEVLAASITEEGVVGYSFLLRYPALFHQDFLTHREFSRSSSSTRAIPMKKMVKSIRSDMAEPSHYGKNQPGMQATEELTGIKKKLVKTLWHTSGIVSTWFATIMNKAGVHKQVGNMILWPYMHMNTILTTTSIDNFIKLRNHPDARPEIKELAEAILKAARTVKPKPLKKNEWHTPFITDEDRISIKEYANSLDMNEENILLAVSTARCARVSYMSNATGKRPSITEDLSLFDRLVVAEPLHASPAEHQFKSDYMKEIDVREVGKRAFKTETVWEHPELHGNLKGVIQHRKLLSGEYPITTWSSLSER